MDKIVVGTRVGKKPQAETYAEKIAFNDPDRSTPVHDDICIWLDGWLRSPVGLAALTMRDGDKWDLSREVDRIRICRDIALARYKALSASDKPWEVNQAPTIWERWSQWKMPTPPDLSPSELRSITWEKVVGNERWVSGFIDLVASIEVQIRPWLDQHKWCDVDCTRYFDPPTKWVDETKEITYGFEVKSMIPSLGELIRQVRYYENKYPAQYFVVAPDDTYAANLQSQRIGFIHYPSGVISRPGR